MTRTSTCIFALLGVLATSTAIDAAGQYGQTQRSMTVSYSDLNISHPEGAAILLSRIRHAADFVCGGEPDIRNLDAGADYRACTKQAIDNAVAAVDSPLLARLYENPDWNADVAMLNQVPAPDSDVAQLNKETDQSIENAYNQVSFK